MRIKDRKHTRLLREQAYAESLKKVVKKPKVERNMVHNLIHDEEELQAFVDFLPPLELHEVYYLTLICRKKWNPENEVPSSLALKQVLVKDKKDIISKIKQMECKIGGYVWEGKAIDDSNLGVYISVNPCSLLKGAHKALNDLMAAYTDCLCGGNYISPQKTIMSAVHSSKGTRHFIDLDIDLTPESCWHEIEAYIRIVTGQVPKFIQTKNGYHCLLSVEQLKGNKVWHQRLSDVVEITINVDIMPVPGCNQGGFVPVVL